MCVTAVCNRRVTFQKVPHAAPSPVRLLARAWTHGPPLLPAACCLLARASTHGPPLLPAACCLLARAWTHGPPLLPQAEFAEAVSELRGHFEPSHEASFLAGARPAVPVDGIAEYAASVWQV